MTEPKLNLDEALGFLRRWPTAFVHLVAIKVDPVTHEKVRQEDGGIEGKSFTKDDLDDDGPVAKFIETLSGKANLYFTTNSLLAPMRGKPGKKEMAEVVAFHVDVDVPAGESQQSTAVDLATRIATFPIEPSVIISSGGGVQAFWILQDDQRIPLEGDKAKCEDAERYTRWLESAVAEYLGTKADATHNVDRIMRLPGTINVPDIKKIAKGRTAAQAALVSFTDLRYPLGCFERAQTKEEAQRAKANTGRKSGGGAEGPVESPLTSLDDARLCTVSRELKEIIRTGVDTEHEGGLVHMHVVCQLIRAGCSAFVIKAAYRLGKISEGAGSWPRGFDGEMDRLIRRAVDAVADPDLDAMNVKHAVINIGGKTKVLTWQPSTMYEGQDEAQISSFEDFTKLHNNRTKDVEITTDKGSKTVRIPLGEWWLRNKQRRQFNGGFKFMPKCESEEVGETLNLWRGFAVPAVPGDCSKFLYHVREVLCSGNNEYFEYIMKWMAFVVQRRTRAEIALLLRSDEEGTGKGIFGQYFGRLFGPHYMQVTQPQQVIGNFNQHLETLLVLHADEALFAGDPRHRNALWSLITEPMIAIEQKGIDVYKALNYLSLIITTNAKHALQIDATSRRIFALDVSNKHLGDGAYFSALEAEMKGDGPSALLAHLQAIDLTEFEIRKVPKTDSLERQKALSRHGVDAVIEELAHTACLPFQHRSKENMTSTYDEQNNKGFWSWCKQNFPDMRRDSPRGLVSQFKAYGVTTKTSGNAYLVFPELKDLRAVFEKKHGPQDWAGDPVDWVKFGGGTPHSSGPAPSGQGPAKSDSSDAQGGIPF